MTDPLADDFAIQNLPGQVGKALRNAKQYHRNPTSLDVGTGVVGSANAQTDIETTGWICRDNGAGGETWQRDVLVAVDGVQGTPMPVDSGIDCGDPAPATIYSYQSVEFCISGQVEVQILQSVDGGNFANFGASIPTGRLCGQGEYVGQICYELIPPASFDMTLPAQLTNPATVAIPDTSATASFTPTATGDYTFTIRADSAVDNGVSGSADNPRFRTQVGFGFSSFNVYNVGPATDLDGNVPILEQIFVLPLTAGVQYNITAFADSFAIITNPSFTITPTAALSGGKKTAYGLRLNGNVTYYDSITNQIPVPGTFTVCPPANGEAAATEVHTPHAVTLLEGGANSPNYPNWGFADLASGAVTSVKSFTVLNTSQEEITVSTPKGDTVLAVGGIRTWGSPTANTLLDVTGISINYPDEPVTVIWEE